MIYFIMLTINNNFRVRVRYFLVLFSSTLENLISNLIIDLLKVFSIDATSDSSTIKDKITKWLRIVIRMH